MAEMQPKLTNDQKQEIKRLETGLKTAFTEKRFEDLQSLSERLKSLDPQNRLAVRLLEKMEKEKKEEKRKANAKKIEELEDKLKAAFKAVQFDHVRQFADELKALDPENKYATKMLKKAEEAKIKAERRRQAEKINALQDKMKEDFEKGNFEEMRKISKSLLEIDPANAFVIKMRNKMDKIKKAAREKERQDKIKALKTELKEVFKKKQFDAVQQKSNALLELEWNNGFALKMLRALAREKEVPFETMVTVQPPKGRKLKIGFFAKLADMFTKKKKKEKEEKEVAVPVAALPPEIAGEKAPQKAPAKPEKAPPAEQPQGNVFTRMFGRKEAEAKKPEKKAAKKAAPSIMDTILTHKEIEKKVPKAKEEVVPGLALLNFSKVFLRFTIAFIVISAGFFYVQNIDAGNRVLALFGVEENYASRLHGAARTLEEKMALKKNIRKEISRYEKGYDSEYQEIIQKVMEKRINWPDILVKINEITESVYPQNDLAQYVQYNNFSFDVEKGIVRVGGTLSDPLGKNLTGLTELEEAFRYYPRDKRDPDDKRTPYFFDVQELRSVSKSLDKRENKYKSNFQISFSTKEKKEEKKKPRRRR